MDEEVFNTVNLDLNLGPDPELGLEVTTNTPVVDLAGWTNGPSQTLIQSMGGLRTRYYRPRFRQINMLPVLTERHSPSIELSRLLISSANGAGLPVGEGSIAGGERVNEESKKCENGNGAIKEDSVKEEKSVIEKSVGTDGSFFDCYVCLDLAKDPVVTNCGHLYCWACLYQWLQASEAKECPVCKGEISVKTLTPIYGRVKNKQESEEVSDTKLPSRPLARRMESLRTSLQRSGYVPAEMIRHLQDRLERESSTGDRRSRPFLNQFMTSRGVRAEQNQSSAPIDDDTLISNIAYEIEGENGRSSGAMSIRRHNQTQRSTSAARIVDAYLIVGGNQEQNSVAAPVGVEDRDSFSSIVGVMNSESQVDTTVEIDSMVTVSTSSSVRRHENGSRVSDVDSADSRPLRRRRRLA